MKTFSSGVQDAYPVEAQEREERKMEEMRIFKNEEFGTIRTIEINGEFWFVGKDVAEALGYVKARNAIAVHVSQEDKKDALIQGDLGGTQAMTVINVSGLYSLILSSKLESAKRFKHWVTSEVLPSIREHGTYMTQEFIQKTLDNPDYLIAIATKIKEEREARKKLEAKLKEERPHAILGRAITTAKTSILIGDLAKILNQNGVDVGAKRLFEWLRENGYLIKRKGTDWNMPTQRSMDLELFEVKESVHIDGNGCNKITRTTKVTGKGQAYFVNRFLSKKE